MWSILYFLISRLQPENAADIVPCDSVPGGGGDVGDVLGVVLGGRAWPQCLHWERPGRAALHSTHLSQWCQDCRPSSMFRQWHDTPHTQHAGSHHRPWLHQGDQGGHCQSYHLHLCEQDPAVQRDNKQDRRGRECYLIITDLWHLSTGSGCVTCDKLCLVFRVQWLVTTSRPQAVL